MIDLSSRSPILVVGYLLSLNFRWSCLRRSAPVGLVLAVRSGGCFLQLGLRRQLVQRRTGSHALSREHTAARFHKKLSRAKCLRRFSKPIITMKKQKELEGLCAQDQNEIKRLKQKLRHEGKALAEAAALLIALKKIQAFWGEPRSIDVVCRPAE